MINLLPPEMKQEYHYARRNRRLLRWSFALLSGLAGIVLLTAGGLLIMDHATTKSEDNIAKTKASLAMQNIAETQKQVSLISGNLRLLSNVLSKEVLFSEMLVQLGKVMPPNVTLSNLSISQTAGAIDVNANAKSYDAAVQLHANLADPGNRIFSKADIVSISCSATAAGAYPCSISIRALFAANSPFLFINTNKAGV